MFTGIVEEIGKIEGVQKGSRSSILKIAARRVLEGSQIGDSIACNGVCLTVTNMSEGSYECDVMAETLRRSNLGELKAGDRVNLERALAVGSRLGGHIVSGHIDGRGTIVSMEREDNAVWVMIRAEKEILRYIIEKGSIAIDGISLTVAYVDDKVFRISMIPHTGEATTLLSKKPGDSVNLENDLIGKYVEKLLFAKKEEEKEEKENLTMDFLSEYGFI